MTSIRALTHIVKCVLLGLVGALHRLAIVVVGSAVGVLTALIVLSNTLNIDLGAGPIGLAENVQVRREPWGIDDIKFVTLSNGKSIVVVISETGDVTAVVID